MPEIKERPILFSAPMVRAILEGRKTVTRRAIKVQPHIDASGNFCVGGSNYGQDGYGKPVTKHFVNDCCPYGKPGDRLWVRETWARIRVAQAPDQEWVVYRECDNRTDYGGPWKPGIHMLRRDSRILLEVTAVRGERLQDISDEQAQAEGIIPVPKTTEGSHQFWRNYHLSGDGTFCVRTPKESFESLWCHVAGGSFPKGAAAYQASPHSWNANPWVWVVEFKRVTP
ncbi:hypothetical protein HX786_00660 [Pseudomonas sp. 21615526]|uniref:hypothetical protein n=1 Tax=Pseudomonas sp. 21615526 TaxID=2738811 RepID=UPI0015BF18D7|nr:hypothetical protein [Pseudomonas sp. 21615526]NVZ36566.1 hypothetical protein [Pseudomonas sp. 21615526]